VAVAGDGQVRFGQTIMKAGARKVRKMHTNRSSPASRARRRPFTLFARFEAKLEEHRANLRAPPSSWPRNGGMDRVLRRLERFLAVADAEASFIVSGTAT